MSDSPYVVYEKKVGKGNDILLVAIDPVPNYIDTDKFGSLGVTSDTITRMLSRITKEGTKRIVPRFGYVTYVQFSSMEQIKNYAERNGIEHILLATKHSLYADFLLENRDKFPIVNNGRLAKDDLREWRANPITIGGLTYYTTPPWKQILLSSRNPHFINLAGLIVEDLSRVLKPVKKLPHIDLQSDKWFTIIDTIEGWREFFPKLAAQKNGRIALDTETFNLERVHNNGILTIQVSWDGKHAYVIALEHKDSKMSPEDVDEVREDVRRYLEFGSSKYLVGHNLSFDLHVLRQFSGAKFVKHKIFDTMVSRYIIDENSIEAGKGRSGLVPGIYTLGGNAVQFGSFAYMDSPIGKSDRGNLASYPLRDVAVYGAIDGIIPWHLVDIYLDLGKRQPFRDYESTVVDLGGASILSFTEMEHNGIYLDVPYLRKMASKDSPLKDAISEAAKKFYDYPTVKEVNKELAESMGYKERQGLFEVQELPWVFGWSKKPHQAKLFVDKLGLKPLERTEKGDPKLDKAYFAQYKNVEECKLYSEIKLRDKVYSTNIVSFHKIGEESPDDRVRSYYSFIGVTTMRSSSNKPNLQNLPNHGPYAKPVKRQFVAPKGRILVSYDLNANEVKNFGNIARDFNITDSFGIGMRLRRKLAVLAFDMPDVYQEIHDTLVPFANGDPEDSADIGKCLTKASDEAVSYLESKYPDEIAFIRTLAIEGDIHRMNVQKFIGIPAQDVSRSQRQEIKAVVFGSLYGMGPLKLSKSIWAEEWEPYIYLSHQEQRDNKAVRKLTNRARDLQNSMWSGWPQAKEFVDHTAAIAERDLCAATVTGNIRHLWGYLSPFDQVRNQQVRQANNSMVQGPSSAINTIAGRIVHTFFHIMRSKGYDIQFMNNNSVHDANYFEGTLVTLPIAMYFITHAATDQTAEYCRKYFGWDMIADPEIDFTVGLDQTQQVHLNWTRPNFVDTISSLTDDEETIKAATHNFDIINAIRVKELKAIGDKLGGYNSMSLKPSKVGEIGLIFPKP